MNTVKPVSLEMELDFHERLLHTVGKNIAQTKKRLHDAELILNLRPPDHEIAETQEWNVKVSQLIDRRDPLQFPTLYKVRKEYESKALIKSIRSGRQRIESDEKFNQRMNRILAREAELIKKKVLSNSASFGKKLTGEPIRTIDDYKGGNTSYGPSRTLIVKEGSYVPPEPNKSSIPSWMGPGHYPNAAKIPKFNIHDTQSRVAFKSQPRDAMSEEVMKRNAVERRRRQIAEFKQRISASESQASGAQSRANTGNGTESLESFYTAFGEGSSALSGSGGSKASSPVRKSALELAKSDHLGDSVNFELTFDEDGGNSLTSSVTQGSSMARSRGSTRGSQSGKSKMAVLFQDESMTGQDLPGDGENSNASTPRTAASSLFSQVRGKSILKSNKHTNVPPSQRRPAVLNPVYSRNDLTIKLITADERVNSQFFKVKDYTMNAFALHSPQVAYVDEFEPADAEGVPDPAAGVYQNRSSGPFRKGKPFGTFTSDIFVVKPPEYVPPKPVSQQERAERTLDASATQRVSSPDGGASNSTPPPTGQKARTKPTPEQLARQLVSDSDSIGQKEKKVTKPRRPLHEPARRPNTKPYKLPVLAVDIEADHTKCERTMTKIIQRRHDSLYFDHQHAMVDEDALSLSSGPVVTSVPDGTSGYLDAAPVHVPPSAVSTSRSVGKWLSTNGVIRANTNQPRVEGQTFLREHKPLPSIALSLTGLLLDDNPYSPEDEFMRDMFHRPASEIGL